MFNLLPNSEYVAHCLCILQQLFLTLFQEINVGLVHFVFYCKIFWQQLFKEKSVNINNNLLQCILSLSCVLQHFWIYVQKCCFNIQMRPGLVVTFAMLNLFSCEKTVSVNAHTLCVLIMTKTINISIKQQKWQLSRIHQARRSNALPPLWIKVCLIVLNMQ